MLFLYKSQKGLKIILQSQHKQLTLNKGKSISSSEIQEEREIYTLS